MGFDSRQPSMEVIMAIEMSRELREELRRLGIPPEKVLWGERISGSPSGARLRLPNGEEQYFSGPFVSVRVGAQCAIVRFN